jgi:EmrB/QacA subfamily drug resistance transporter
VIGAYALTFGSFLILGGRAGDLFGRRRTFRTGLAVFTLASLLGGTAQASWALVGGRVLQGVGAALVSPAALSILTTTFREGAARNRALGAWGAVSAVGGAVGVLVGGPLTGLSWRWVLLINVPIGLAAVLAAPRVVAESRDVTPRRLDLPGALLITGGLAALVYGLSASWAGSGGLGRPGALVPMAVGVALIGVFLAVEARAPQPLVPLRTFRMRNLSGGNLVSLLVLGVVTATTYFLTLYFQQVLGYSPVRTAFAFMPQILLIMVAANVVGRVIARVGVRTILAVSTAVMTVGTLLFLRLGADASYLAVLLPAMLVSALGAAAGMVGGSVAATSGLPPRDQGLASGLFNTAQQVGAALGLAILVAVANGHTADAGSSASVVAGYRWAFGGAAVFGLIAFAVTLLVIRRPGRVQPPEIAEATGAGTAPRATAGT